MRFFTTIFRAGQAEFIAVAIAVFGMTWALLRYVLKLGIAVDPIPLDSRLFESDTYTYDSSALGLVVVGLVVLFFLLMMNAGRRLKDLDQSFALAVLMFIPGLNVLLTLYLATATATKDMFTPYGKNPYDPNSWIPPEADAGGSGMSIEGEDIYLPGEDRRAA